MLTLAVSSSTGMVSVALGYGGRVLVERSAATDRRHAEELTPMIADVLSAAARTPSELERLVVDVGPGRFTGLRVGVTTVRTLAIALGLEIVPVTSLESLAAEPLEASPAGGGVLAVVDARRSEVFVQRFVGGLPITDPLSLSPSEAAEIGRPGDVVLGDGADRYPEAFGGLDHVVGREPSAAVMLAISEGRPSFDGPAVEPLYLRDPDVQVNIKTRHDR